MHVTLELAAFATQLQLLDAATEDLRVDEKWVSHRVMLWLGWRWWHDVLWSVPDDQLDALRAHAADGLDAADDVLHSLTTPSRRTVNAAHGIGIGLAIAQMSPGAPPLFGIDRLPTYPRRPGLPLRSLRWCDRVDGRPPSSGQPITLVGEIAEWYWDAAAGARPMCRHGVIHHPGAGWDRRDPHDGVACPLRWTCDSHRGRRAPCDGCCQP